MRKINKLLAVLLAVLLVAGCLPMYSSALVISDDLAIITAHMELDGSGNYTKNSFDDINATPGFLDDIPRDNTVLHLSISTSDMTDDTFEIPYFVDDEGTTWYLQKIALANYLPGSAGFGTSNSEKGDIIETLIDDDEIKSAESADDYDFDIEQIDESEFPPLSFPWNPGLGKYYIVLYGWTPDPPEEWGIIRETYQVDYKFELPDDAGQLFPIYYDEEYDRTYIDPNDDGGPGIVISKVEDLSDTVVEGRQFQVAEDFRSNYNAGEYDSFLALDIDNLDSPFYYFDGWVAKDDPTQTVYETRQNITVSNSLANANDKTITFQAHWTKIDDLTPDQLEDANAKLTLDVFNRSNDTRQNIIITQWSDSDENQDQYNYKTGDPVVLQDGETISYMVSAYMRSTINSIYGSQGQNYIDDFANFTFHIYVDNRLSFANVNEDETVSLIFSAAPGSRYKWAPVTLEETNIENATINKTDEGVYAITFKPTDIPLTEDDTKMDLSFTVQWQGSTEWMGGPINVQNTDATAEMTITGLDFKLKDGITSSSTVPPAIETSANITGTIQPRYKTYHIREYYETVIALLRNNQWTEYFHGDDGDPVAYVHALQFMNYKLKDYDLAADTTATLKANTVVANLGYTITATAGENGTITPTGETQVYKGESQTFTITPNSGYQIDEVKVDGEIVEITGNTYTFTNVTDDHTIEVTFEKTSTPPSPPIDDEPADPDDTGVSDLLDTENHNQYLFGYPEETFGPDQNMTRAEVAQMFYNLLVDKNVAITATFEDVPADAWYAKSVNTLASMGIISGVGENRFEPERSITRAEFTSMAMKFTKGALDGTNVFSDVRSGDWFYEAVVGSIQYGWIEGYEDGTFRPENWITRVEVTSIVNKMLGRFADREFVAGHADELNAFSDVTSTHWGYYHIVEATNSHTYTKPSTNVETWTELK